MKGKTVSPQLLVQCPESVFVSHTVNSGQTRMSFLSPGKILRLMYMLLCKVLVCIRFRFHKNGFNQFITKCNG